MSLFIGRCVSVLYLGRLKKRVFKDVLMGIPKSDVLGVTSALIRVTGQQFLAVSNGLMVVK